MRGHMSHPLQPPPKLQSPLYPEHVAIIMDGNGRWAKQRQKIRAYGHRLGAEAVRKIVTSAVKKKIPVLTLFAFSSENWCRPTREVNALMELFLRVLRSNLQRLHVHNVCLKIIGDDQSFPKKLQEHIAHAQQLTADNTGLRLNIAANYGGQWDITQAARCLVRQAHTHGLAAEDVTRDKLASCLSLSEFPDVDLLIRTGGEQRISNFLLWQLAYAELYFTDTLWPDFDEESLNDALISFKQRQRRFGGVKNKNSETVLSKEGVPC